MSPDQAARGKVRTWVTSQWKLCASRVSSQWKSTDLSLIALAVTRWLRTNQPELLQPGADSFTFDADILDDTTSDVLLQIDLSQNYLVEIDGDGVERVYAVEQNDPVLDDFLGAGGADPVPNIAAILLDGAPFLPPDIA